jgi:hypothetical protein
MLQITIPLTTNNIGFYVQYNIITKGITMLYLYNNSLQLFNAIAKISSMQKIGGIAS